MPYSKLVDVATVVCSSHGGDPVATERALSQRGEPDSRFAVTGRARMLGAEWQILELDFSIDFSTIVFHKLVHKVPPELA